MSPCMSHRSLAWDIGTSAGFDITLRMRGNDPRTLLQPKMHGSNETIGMTSFPVVVKSVALMHEGVWRDSESVAKAIKRASPEGAECDFYSRIILTIMGRHSPREQNQGISDDP